MPIASDLGHDHTRRPLLLGGHRVIDLDLAGNDLLSQRLHLGDHVRDISAMRHFGTCHVGIEARQRHAALVLSPSAATCGWRPVKIPSTAISIDDVGALLDVVHHQRRAPAGTGWTSTPNAATPWQLGHRLEDAAVRARRRRPGCGRRCRPTIAPPRSCPRAGSENGLFPPTQSVGEIDVRLAALGPRDEAVRVAVKEGDIERANCADLPGLGCQRSLGPGQKRRFYSRNTEQWIFGFNLSKGQLRPAETARSDRRTRPREACR